MNEGSGTIAYDLSGNGFDANFVNTPLWVSRIYGGGLMFDGIDDYLFHDPDATGFSDFSISLFMYVNDTILRDLCVYKHANPYQYTYLRTTNTAKGQFGFRVNSTDVVIGGGSGGTFDGTQLNLFTVLFDRDGTADMYFNETLNDQDDISGLATSEILDYDDHRYIGKSPLAGGYWNGTIRNFLITLDLLTPTEIGSLTDYYGDGEITPGYLYCRVWIYEMPSVMFMEEWTTDDLIGFVVILFVVVFAVAGAGLVMKRK